MIHVVIAGGSGTRFWPLSRRQRPKQLVELWSDRTMIEETVDRLRTASPEGRVIVVCGEHLVEPTREALQDFHDVEFLVEPAARDTLPAIALAAADVLELEGDHPMGIYPADHYIGDVDGFTACVGAAEREARDGKIATMGIEPTRPETGYGYIHFDASTSASGGDGRLETHPVRAFVEKPSREVAERYLRSGEYLWNSGMFAFKPSTLFTEMQRQLPEMASTFESLRASWRSDDRDELVADAFEEIEPISIDYGIMEGAEEVVVVPAKFSWSDVGHWAAIDEVSEVDEAGNVVEATATLENVTDSVVFSEGTDRHVAGIDLDGMVVVDTEDAVLVVPKESAQKVRDLVDRLDEEGLDDLL